MENEIKRNKNVLNETTLNEISFPNSSDKD